MACFGSAATTMQPGASPVAALARAGTLDFVPGGIMTIASPAGSDIATIRGRVVRSLLEQPSGAAQVRALVESLQPDGSWKEVDYQSKETARWGTVNHLQRILTLAQAFRAPGHPLAGDAGIRDAIRRAFRYWIEHDFQCPNWWFNEIQVPRTVGQILLLLGQAVEAPDREKAITVIMSRSRIGMTGQNRVWMAENVFTRGLLTGDDALVRQALDALLEELRVTTSEGIQPDGSFHQHGPQQQFGNYGLSFAETETRWAALVQGTGFALSAEKRDALRLLLLEGMRWVVWRGRMDISGLGRQLRSGAQQARGRGVATAFRSMRLVDPAMAGEYDRLLAGFDPDPPAEEKLAGNRAFWRSDMIVHRTPVFYTSVRMSSARVAINESINGENLLGSLMGDGATYLYRRGDEYDDVLPVWDWHRLPGVTAYTGEPLPGFKTRNSSRFVGSVSDGRDGAAVMELDREGLAAHKSWFFSSDQIVCLGAGIRTAADREVATTLNQCLLKGDVVTAAGGRTATLAAGNRQRLEHPAWVHHDGVGYVFLSPATVSVSNREQSGTWKSVVNYLSEAAVTKPVFSLGIEHGRRPTAGSYAYLILPGATTERLTSLAQHPDIRVLSNTPALQAIQDEPLHLTQAAFHRSGELPMGDGVRLGVDAACLLMVRQEEKRWELTVSDPAQSAGSVGVMLSGRFTGEGCQYDAATGKSAVRMALPAGGEAGKSVTRTLTRVP
jgi:chondroitin AC lyase